MPGEPIHMRKVLVLLASLAFVFQPARAATAAETQAALWLYGDTGGAWTGADGTYSVELPDGRTAWLFSDTFLGTVNPDHSRPRSSPFVHNSIVVQDGGSFSTIVSPGPDAAIVPREGAGFYWLGDAIVENDELLVFCLRFVAAPVPFGFQQIGVDIARFSLPSMTLTTIERAPHAWQPAPTPVSYGSAIMRDGAYDYIYGSEDLHIEKYLHVARVPAGHLLDGTWEYYGSDGWTTNAVLSSRLASGISNEMSVAQVGGEYVSIAMVGAEVRLAEAPAPEGPWSVARGVFTAPEASQGLIVYNAKAHEQLSAPGSLLVSYNVNALNVNDLYDNVNNYRPRFVDVTL